MRLISLFFVMILSFSWMQAQDETKEKTATLVSSLSAFYAYEIPGADLAVRFGNNHKVGAAFTVKTAQNWLFQIEGGYLFSNNLKEEALSIFDDIKTEQGMVTSKFGTPGSILLNERGFSLYLKFGKILPFLQANDNSGPCVTVGLGLLQHKIRIDNESNDTPQVLGDYQKGYDHLTNGLALNQFVGYRFYAQNKMINFYAGVEFTQAFTKNRRGYNYNTMSYDDAKRLDLQTSFKFGFVIPLSRRTPDDFYIF